MKKLLCLLLAILIVGSITACEKTPEDAQDVLKVGYSQFEGLFSPFYAETVADRDAMELTQIRLLYCDRSGAVVYKGIEGETRPYNGTNYTYYGPADLTVTENKDGTVFYDFVLREDLLFSDGAPVTVDDLIFSLYVLLDPSYNGPSRLNTMPIQGLRDYCSGNMALSALLAQLGEDNTDYTLVTPEEQTIFWAAVDGGLTTFAQRLMNGFQAMADAERKEGEEPIVYTTADIAAAYGLTALEEDATVRDLGIALAESFRWDFEAMDAWFSDGFIPVTDLPELLGEAYGYAARNVTSGTHARTISGIQKTGPYSLRVVADSLDVSMVYYLGEVCIAPLHYYGDAELYDYENGSFGFVKGDLSAVKAKNAQPMGAGPYRWEGYQDFVAAYSANERYYLSCPKTERVELYAGTRMSILNGKVDISYLHSGRAYEGEPGMLTEIKVLSANDGAYWYIGLNPQTMNVADEPDTPASKNLRKGFATVIAACRQAGFDASLAMGGGYSGQIIDYPLSNTVWLVPGQDDEAYETAYAKDVYGNNIYSPGMTQEECLAAAQRAALDFFEAAGYTVEEGVVTAAPEGAAVSYEARVWCNEEDPVLQTLLLARDALAEVGMELVVTNTVENEDLPYPAAGSCDVWTCMWGAVGLAGAEKEWGLWEEWYAMADPDAHLYGVYHTNGIQSAIYRLSDSELEALIEAARATTDQARRKELYCQCLGIIMDWACEVPFYQAEDTLLVLNESVDLNTVAPDISTFYSWLREIHILDVN